eukprot:m.26632 g.26632  ORF g.26632 m.26632 type:complete len:300 (-) comp7817_c0_seq1:225-1124(-)
MADVGVRIGDNTGTLLTVVLDCASADNPVWSSAFSSIYHQVITFCNSHVAMKSGNTVALVAFARGQTELLYPTNNNEKPDCDVTGKDGNEDTGMHEGLFHFNQRTLASLQRFQKRLAQEQETLKPPSMSAGLSRALCYTNRYLESVIDVQDETQHTSLGRILVVASSEDPRPLNMINTFFAAQSKRVPIDTCFIAGSSGLLQQAAKITHGIYSELPSERGLLVHLLATHLADAEDRSFLALPEADGLSVDHTGLCSCHQPAKRVETGYACSDCLNIFCDETKKKKPKQCPNCGGAFVHT